MLLLSDWCLYYLSMHRCLSCLMSCDFSPLMPPSSHRTDDLFDFVRLKLLAIDGQKTQKQQQVLWAARAAVWSYSQRDTTCVTCHMEYLTIDGAILVFTGLQKQQSSVSFPFIELLAVQERWLVRPAAGHGRAFGGVHVRTLCRICTICQSCFHKISEVWRTKDFSQSKGN